MTEKISCKFVSWDDVYSKCEVLSDKIKQSDWHPNTLIAIARSGFVPGRILSDFLGVTDLVSLKVEHWLDTTAQHKDEATIPYKVQFELENKKVLVVDDIVDTGKSMEETLKYLKSFNPKEVKSAVMQYLTCSNYEPDYYADKEECWTWFVYPWNVVEDSCNLISKLLQAKGALTPNEILPMMKENYNLDYPKEKLYSCLNELASRNKITLENDKWKLT